MYTSTAAYYIEVFVEEDEYMKFKTIRGCAGGVLPATQKTSPVSLTAVVTGTTGASTPATTCS